MVLHTQNSECGGWTRIPLEMNLKVERGIWFEVFQCQTRNYPTENNILHKVHSCISRRNATNYDMNMRKNGLLESNPKVERGIQIEILECQMRNYPTENNILHKVQNCISLVNATNMTWTCAKMVYLSYLCTHKTIWHEIRHKHIHAIFISA